ncbi:LPS translocon maturation chaperone LptM [Marinomonas algarum]|uniref:Lipoprotein n=1 Tax=Marinomonas algarum TaxID=2883105 RepID=A0A9X1LFD7_9GAMM|nr:lipoprotein [Marinomonas algarum]MCB5162910.1 lipoprotein [Marinomonas algarum]
MYRWLLVCVFAVLLAACGNKGALYLPDDTTQVQQTSSL